MDIAAVNKDHPFVIMGDFNTDPEYPRTWCGDRKWKHEVPNFSLSRVYRQKAKKIDKLNKKISTLRILIQKTRKGDLVVGEVPADPPTNQNKITRAEGRDKPGFLDVRIEMQRSSIVHRNQKVPRLLKHSPICHSSIYMFFYFQFLWLILPMNNIKISNINKNR